MLKVNNTALALRKAREIIENEENWCTDFLVQKFVTKKLNTTRFLFWAKESVEQTEQYQQCALGAIGKAVGLEIEPGITRRVDLERNFAFKELQGLLNRQAWEQYHTLDIAEVNNELGHEAVLSCFDAAIAEAESTY